MDISNEQREFFKDSLVRDEEGNLLVCYHGSTQEFNEFNHYTNWFSLSKSYSKSYAPTTLHLYKVYLNCRVILEVGSTDSRVFSLMKVTYPYMPSKCLLDICDKLNVSYESLFPIIEECAKENTLRGDNYKDNMYRMDLFQVVNTKTFRDFLVGRGYDGIRTIEYGYVCYGVFSNYGIKDIANKFPQNTPLLKDNYSAKLSDNFNQREML